MQVPAQRLRLVLADLERAEQSLLTRQARFESMVGSWIANGAVGERPVPDVDLVAAERALAQAMADAKVARSALPDADRVVAQASRRVSVAAAHRMEALHQAAVEIALAYVADELRPLVERAAAAIHVVRGVSAALRSVNAHDHARRVDEAGHSAMVSRPVADDAQIGQRLLAELLHDPLGAVLS